MGKLRARLAKHPVDREALAHLNRVSVELRKAAGVYERAKGPLRGSERRRMQERIDLLKSAMAAVSSIRPVQSKIDYSDLDLKTEGREG